MASMGTAAKVSRNGQGSASVTGVGAPLPTRQRRPGYVALAVVLMVGLAALGAYFYTQAGAKTPVVVVVHRIPAGHTVQRADLSTVDVAGAVTAIGGDHVGSVVGQTAVVELLPNTLLQRAMVSAAPALGGGQAQVGVHVKPGQIPAEGLSPGDMVEVLELPGTPTGGTAAAVSSASSASSATVLADGVAVYSSVPDPSQAGGTLLTVVVPRSAAAGIASASNAGLIALVRVGQ